MGSGAIESAIRRVMNLRLKGSGMMWHEGNAEGMLLLRAAALTGRWDEALDRAIPSKWQDGRLDWIWTSPDMPFQLRAKVTVKPPATQVQSASGDRRIPA
jgi:hypothetical protein